MSVDARSMDDIIHHVDGNNAATQTKQVACQRRNGETKMIQITVTCEENFSVLCVDTSTAMHENVVREFCEAHNCDAIENVFTVDADEAGAKVVSAAIEFLEDAINAASKPFASPCPHDYPEMLDELKSIVAAK